jgi:polygalacturonase
MVLLRYGMLVGEGQTTPIRPRKETIVACGRRGIRRIAILAAAAAVGGGTMANAATVCDASAYGAKADGTTMNTEAIQAAIDACAKKGGGRVRLAGGIFLSGPIVLKSGINLDIAQGTTLQGSSRHDDYPKKMEFRNPGLQSLVSATDANDVSITGGGVIDGAGESWWKAARAQGDHGIMGQGLLRPRLIVFDHCHKILMEGVTVQNSPFWQIVAYYSNDVTIRNIRVLAEPSSPNTDAIDPFSSSNIRIEHVYADVGDDDVAIKSGQSNSPGPDAPSKDITISDCTFMHGHGLSIGSEVSGGVQNIRVVRVHFKGTANGIRIKSNRDRGGDIGNFDFRDVTMEDVGTPVLITGYYPKIPDQDSAQPITRLTPRFHDIRITNLSATGAKTAGFIVGLPESPIKSITLANVHISAEKGMTISNATVTAHDFAVKVPSGVPLIMLQHAKVPEK